MTLTPEQLAEAMATIEAAKHNTNGNGIGAASAGGGWGIAPAASFAPAAQPGFGAQPAAGNAMPQPTGVSIPIKLRSGEYTVRCYAHYGPEVLGNLLQFVMTLANSGIPIDAWKDKPKGFAGNGGGFGGGGGFSR